MIEPEDNIFRLFWHEDDILKTLDTTPLNWGEGEMGLSRDFISIKREITNGLSLDSEASTVVTNALNGNYSLFLTLYRKQNDWTMQEVRTWTADMTSYKLSKGMVSISFKSSTAREEIEKNKSTKYDIYLGSNRLNYSGIDNDANNIVSGIAKKLTSSSPYHYEPANWVLQGNHSTVEYSTMTFDNFQITITETTTISLRLKVGLLEIEKGAGTTLLNDKLMLLHYRGNTLLNHIIDLNQNGGSQLLTVFNYPEWYEFSGIDVLAGDKIRLILNTTTTAYIDQKTAYDLRLEVTSFESSPYTDYPVQVDTIPTIISSLLAKMCAVPPALNYGLTENPNFLPVLTSAQGLAQSVDPIITISFEDIMKCLFMLYEADYEVVDVYEADYEVVDGLGSDLTLDILPMNELMSNVQAEVLEAVNTPELSASDEHVYGTVKVGYETDDNAKNGQYDPMCTNVFKLGNSEKELDLVCPFKASPTTIEQFIRDKKTSSSTTKDSDTSVFLFCVAPFVDGETTLYRGHSFISSPTPYLVNNNFFNLPYSPMRIMTNVGKYLKVSMWNNSYDIQLVSSERTANLRSLILDISSNIVWEKLASTDLKNEMQYPLFLPFNVDFEGETEPFTKTEINENPRKYYTVTDINSNEVYNVYINDITLPLTKHKTATFTGLLKYDV